MNILGSFFVQNFILICVSIVLYTMAIQRFKQHPRISFYTILVISCAISLAVFGLIENIAKANGNIPLALICAVFGYISRPACIYFLIMTTKGNRPVRHSFLILLPLLLNAVIYCIAFIPNTSTIIFGFAKDVDGTLDFVGGPLRYTAHIISAFYLGYLLVSVIISLKSRYLSHSLALIACAVFITTAVIIETFFNDENQIAILNSTIAVCTLTYYLFIYIEQGSIDTLTNLFNRETYQRDIRDMGDTIKGVIILNIDGMRRINENLGYQEGDKAVVTVSRAMLLYTPNNMIPYRLAGDEFIIISNTCLEEELLYVMKKIKANLSKTFYSCSIGYAYCDDKSLNFQDLLKEAERKMRLDKEEYYRTNTD